MRLRTLACLGFLIALTRPALSQQPRVHPDPDSSRFIVEDIARFWAAFDRAKPESLSVVLQRDYLDQGTPGLKAFTASRLRTGAAMAEAVGRRRLDYESIRPATLNVAAAERVIRAPLYALEYLYPAAVFPDVYFMIGRFATGGTVSNEGLLIGTEMFKDAEGLRMIVSHELIHFQQMASGQYMAAEKAPTLLALAILEGSADFIGELISGRRGKGQLYDYGAANEAQLWKEFQPQMLSSDPKAFEPWFYGTPMAGRPRDLGYFIGYKIADAYYARAADKKAAIREILTTTNFEGLLKASGYQPAGR
jgi:hypothetical protein